MKDPCAIVIGASSGIGAALVKALAGRGYRVAAIARRVALLEEMATDRVQVYCHDVRSTQEAPLVFDRIVENFGDIQLVVYAAGVMPEIEESEYNTVKDEAIVQVNLMGGITWLNLAAAHMEARGTGTLVGISSVAGERGRRGNPAYTAAKAGLSAYLEALRNRLTRYGVQVITIKPGPVDTPMTAGSQQPLMIQVDECVAGIMGCIDKNRPATAYIPRVWRPIMLVIRLIPSFLFRRTNI